MIPCNQAKELLCGCAAWPTCALHVSIEAMNRETQAVCPRTINIQINGRRRAADIIKKKDDFGGFLVEGDVASVIAKLERDN